MQNRFKKLLACLCCVAMMMPLCAFPVSSESEPAADAAASDASGEEDLGSYAMSTEEPLITDDQALAEMELAAENSKMALYYNSKAQIALVDKTTGEVWWSNPINVEAAAGKAAQKTKLKSSMTMTYAQPSKRSTTDQNSADQKVKCKVSVKKASDGLDITYKYGNATITVPVKYTLHDDYLSVNVDTSAIVEEDADKIVTNLVMMGAFGAAEPTEKGYFVVPDGSGAIINFNNGKTNYKAYQGEVYGRNITPVEATKPAVTQNVYLPMYGIVKGNSGMMVVADKGDTCATINAYVTGQQKTSYNACYFDFEIRTDDEYLMGGDANPLAVYEKRGILVPEIEVRYYPVSNDDKSEINYVDIADSYRNYLTSEQGVTKSAAADNSALYIDLYGAVMKQETVFGFPVMMQHETTSFDEAKTILEKLKELGVDDMVVNYNQWTKADITEKIADKAKPASKLGGKKDFKTLKAYAEENGIALYPGVDNLTFESGNGYFTMTDTAIRVSNAYSRQIEYDLAHGVENKFYDAMSLLSPRKYEKMFKNLAKSYSKAGIDNISLGSATTVIYGDYGRNSVSREMFKYNLQTYLEDLKGSVGSILADGANAYVLKYVDHVSNVPLNSSKFDIFDQEIPFYQIVMSGLKPVSTTAVNGDAQVADLILRALATGTNLRFDFVAETADELKDTRYDSLYYANYEYWLEDAAACYKFAEEVLNETAGSTITEYNVLSETKVETVYANGTKTVVDLEARTVDVNGRTISIYDYIGKEVIG
ncbi:MAG: hypothetical protein J6K17_11145 [Oscillospiraceae bacterium]|nr:hypothetical protein [Oscillospiraceae bacterium]